MYHSPSDVFMTNKAHIGTKSITKVPNQKIANGQNVFFFRQASSKVGLHLDGFHMKQQHFTLSSGPAHQL